MKFEVCDVADPTWPRLTIEAICSWFTSGGTPSRKEPRFFLDGTIPWVKTQELRDCLLADTEELITEEAVRKSSAKILPSKTILMAMYGATVGQLGVLTKPMACNQACAAMVVDSTKADYRYLYYQLLAARSQIQSAATGAAQQNLSGTQIKSFSLPFPPLAVQTTIADYLWSLDRRIGLLRETNATLDAIAQALFKSWFVDFDPVRAKAEGRNPDGMDEATAALFPDAFEESELGPVPKGWSLVPLASAYDINPKRQLKKGESAPYADMASVPTVGHGVSGYIPREAGSGSRFIYNDTLLARITPCLENGKTAFVDFLADNEVGWGSTEFVVLRPKPPLPAYHAYLLCRHVPFRDFAIQSMSGTSGRQRVQNDILGRYPVAVPPANVAEAFGAVTTALQQRITQNNRQAQTLATLRDTLLPRLISGQLRVPDSYPATTQSQPTDEPSFG